MSKNLIILLSGFFFLLVFAGWKKIFVVADEPLPHTIIGVEYAFPGQATALAKTGIKGVKYFPDIYEWGDMQKKSGGPIDFFETDRYVKEFQEAGFTSLTMALQSKSDWGSKNGKGLKPTNLSPKPEFADQWKKFVGAVVERYDMDGKDDMPGLKVPVVYYEIGTEFSSYVPESADEYINTLSLAYKAAHDAFANVKILHAAFLTTTAITSKSTPETYESDFSSASTKTGKRILHHSLADNRKILDHPEIFDVVNFHSCGDVYEIEGIAKWLRWEMNKRGYSKQLYISDTTPTPFIAWGNAVDCTLKPEQSGIIVPPFEEADRCKITALMKKVLDGDSASIKWLYGFLATDLVKKCVVASDMHVIQINTAFSEDLTFLKMKILKAGAGTSAWSGMLATKADGKTNMRTVIGYRPMYYALQQVQSVLENYQSIERVSDPDEHVRVYKIVKNGKENFIAWYEPDKIILPVDQLLPLKTVKVKTTGSSFMKGNIVQQMRNGNPMIVDVPVFQAKNGEIELQLNSIPLIVNAK